MFGIATKIRPLLMLSMLALICACQEEIQLSKLEEIQQRGVVRIITRNGPSTYYIDADGPAGLEYELGTRFADYLGVKAQFIVTDNLQQITQYLQNGQADVAAAGLAITPERETSLRFGPPYQNVSQKLVFRQGNQWPKSFEQLEGELRVVAHSSHASALLEAKNQIPSLNWTETTEASSEELLSMVLDGKIQYTIADSNELNLNRRFYPELAIGFTVGKPQQLAWAFPKNEDYSLFVAGIEFFGTLKNSGDLASLIDQYYGHVRTFDYVGSMRFHRAVQDTLSTYKESFIVAAGDDLDWRLLAAMGYQESHWNPKAKSPTGVRGLMMLTLRTAKQLGIESRLDPEQSIRGGAQYLRRVLQRVPDDIPEPDRTWFALAGYNVGWGHVEDARVLTQKQGADPDKWVDVKERLPLLRKKKWYKQTKYGYARGDEPVKYVTNIRRYYDVLVWLDNQNSAPLNPELLGSEEMVADADNSSNQDQREEANQVKGAVE